MSAKEFVAFFDVKCRIELRKVGGGAVDAGLARGVRVREHLRLLRFWTAQFAFKESEGQKEALLWREATEILAPSLFKAKLVSVKSN